MALLGGGVGGAGNPVGGSFTGPAETLEIIGDHCYAYSGSFDASSANPTVLSFTSGNFYTVGEIRLCGMIATNNPPDGRIVVMTVKMNGTTVLLAKIDNETEHMPTSDVSPIIIPPYTEILVNADSDADSSDFIGVISLTGRIYRTRD